MYDPESGLPIKPARKSTPQRNKGAYDSESGLGIKARVPKYPSNYANQEIRLKALADGQIYGSLPNDLNKTSGYKPPKNEEEDTRERDFTTVRDGYKCQRCCTNIQEA